MIEGNPDFCKDDYYGLNHAVDLGNIFFNFNNFLIDFILYIYYDVQEVRYDW